MGRIIHEGKEWEIWNICQNRYDVKNLDERYKQQWTKQCLIM